MVWAEKQVAELWRGHFGVPLWPRPSRAAGSRAENKGLSAPSSTAPAAEQQPARWQRCVRLLLSAYWCLFESFKKESITHQMEGD